MAGVKGANLVVRLAVELAMYASLAYSGASVAGPVPLRAVLGALAPLGAVVLWSRHLAPRARRRLSGPAAIVAETALFSGASVGLATTGHLALAAVFELVAVANAVVVHVFERADDPAAAPAR